jgi:hypothetical protein
MNLSIFTKAQALPSKSDKAKEARFTSKPYYPETKSFNTEEELIDIICNYAWSPSVFSGYRNQANFVSTDLMVLDIDDGMRIEEAEKVVHKLDVMCLCIPSTSFTPEDHRFRLIFPLSRTITSPAVFSSTMQKLAEVFPADPACIGDVARFFFGGKLDDGFWFEEGRLLDPVAAQKLKKQPRMDHSTKANIVVGESLEELVEALYGEKRDKVPESVAYFLENAPDNLAGEWYHRSNSFLFTCGLLGLEQDRVSEVFSSLYPYEELTEKVVDKMILDGYNSREEL